MSSWWCTALFVVGKIQRIRQFEEALPSLFHQVAMTDHVGGGLTAEVCQNYGGEAAVENAIACFPDLVFAGTQAHEQAHPNDIFWVFTGQNGLTDWHEFRLPENGGRPMTREEVDREISHIDTKMARLAIQRELLLHQPSGLDADATSLKDLPAGRLHQSGEVASVVRKISRRPNGKDAPNLPAEVLPEK